MADLSEVGNFLHHLINTCRDGESGYREAAKLVADASIKSFCDEQSQQRARFARELEREVLQCLGHSEWVPAKGSVAAQLHRTWFELKDKIFGGDHAILDSIELGEDNARQIYEHALANQNLPRSTRTVVQRQAEGIMAAYEEVRILRDRVLNV